MGSFKDKAERFLVIDHSDNYSFVACQSCEEVASFVKSRKLTSDYFWVLNLADCIILQDRLLFDEDHQFEKFTRGKS